MVPVSKLVEFSLKKAIIAATYAVARCNKLADIALCSYIWHHGTVSIYLSTNFSSDSFDMNATGTAPQGNKREDPVDLTNVATPCQVNKNCNSSN